MNRTLSALFSALEGLLVVAIGLVIPVGPLTVLWGAQYGFGPDWLLFWRAGSDIWLVGHGVDLTLTLDAATAKASGLSGASTPFVISIAALGFSLVTLLLGRRAGRRIGETNHRLLGEVVATAVVALLSLGIVVSATQPGARPSVVQGIVLPTLVFVVGLLIARYRSLPKAPWVRDWTDETRAIIGTALRAGAASVAFLLTVSALVVAGLLFANYGQVIGLYEGLHSGAIGGAALTVAQIMVIPNLVIWAASWLVGPGFAIGTGSAVSPLATTLGPIPAIPIFGALPSGDFAFAFAGLAVPLLGAFVVGAILARPLGDRLGPDHRFRAILSGALGSGIVGGLLLGALAWASAGSIGPGRLQTAGPEPIKVALLFAIEIAVATAIGMASAYRVPRSERAARREPGR